MEIANLVLEYLKVLLNWPLMVLALAWMFKEPLSVLLKKIKKIGFAGGSLDAEADEASSEVDEIRSVTPPGGERTVPGRDDEKEEETAEAADPQKQPSAEPMSTPEPALHSSSEQGTSDFDPLEDFRKGVANSLNRRLDQVGREEAELSQRRKTVDEAQYYESFRQLAVDSPGAAVREAYQRIRLSGQRLLQDMERTGWRVRVNSLHEIFEALADEKLVNPDAVEPARRLDRIYHSPERSELSAKGALSFVEAAQKLENLIAEGRARLERGNVLRMIKAHPTVKKWLMDFGFAESDVTTTVTTRGIGITFSAPKADVDTDPRYVDLVTRLRGFARAERIVIRINHPDAGSILR